MSERSNPFANLTEPPTFTTKPKTDTRVEKESIERIAEQNNFPSRQSPKPPKVERRKPRTYRTGRNQQFNAKATAETIERFYKAADAKKVALGELMKLALDALDAIEVLQKWADKNNLALGELIKLAPDALESAGVSGMSRNTSQ